MEHPDVDRVAAVMNVVSVAILKVIARTWSQSLILPS